MQNPAAEWGLAIGHLAVLDYLRSIGDADHDTLSEVVRNTVSRHPRGRLMFAGALTVGAVVLHEHIVRPLRG
jgi:hypothetical protein